MRVGDGGRWVCGVEASGDRSFRSRSWEGQRKGLDWFTHVENVVDGQTTLI